MKSNFESLALIKPLLDVVRDLGYERPTPIQLASIPILLKGEDLIGQSKTGSGKTAAFALPILQKIDLRRRRPQALVLCPTRELCAQVAREFRRLGRMHPGLAVLELVGGQPGRPQRESLRRGVHIAVGTPGRLLDHLQREFLDTRSISTVVLDEADRMLDMGFGDDVNEILNALPRASGQGQGQQLQTVLFSATFPEAIEAMSQRVQRRAQRVTIDEPEQAKLPIDQFRVDLQDQDKLPALAWCLKQHPHESALIFCNFKASVAELTEKLVAAGLSADRLDGDLEQFQRDQVLARFRNQSLRILVATDVAGRGIDVEGLDLVINYELPPQPEVYVHRIGRTGRAGKSGLAISLTRGLRDARMQTIEELTGVTAQPLVIDGQLDSASLLQELARPAKMETILISGGRKDKVRPGDILGALTGEAGGLNGKDIGKIEVQATLSYVAVAHPFGREAAERINAGRIKAKRFRATLVRTASAGGAGNVWLER